MLLHFGYFFSLSKLLIFLSSEHIKKQKSKTHFEVSVTVADECACISTAANVSQMISELNKLKQKYKTRRERKRPIFQIPLFQNVFFNIQFFLSKLLFLSFQLCTFFESFKTNFQSLIFFVIKRSFFFGVGEVTNAKNIKADSPKILRPTHFLRQERY